MITHIRNGKDRTYSMDDGATHPSGFLEPAESDSQVTEAEKSLQRLLARIDWESLTQNSKGE